MRKGASPSCRLGWLAKSDTVNQEAVAEGITELEYSLWLEKSHCQVPLWIARRGQGSFTPASWRTNSRCRTPLCPPQGPGGGALWPPPKCWFYRHVPPYRVYVVLGAEPTLGQLSCTPNPLSLGHWVRYLTFLGFTLCICKMGARLPSQELYLEAGRT